MVQNEPSMPASTDAKPPQATTTVTLPPGNGRLLLRQIRRALILVFGLSVLLVGIIMIVAPGPAVVVIPLGLGILATEFLWARRVLDGLKSRLSDAHAATSRVNLPRWVRFFLPKKDGDK